MIDALLKANSSRARFVRFLAVRETKIIALHSEMGPKIEKIVEVSCFTSTIFTLAGYPMCTNIGLPSRLSVAMVWPLIPQLLLLGSRCPGAVKQAKKWEKQPKCAT